MPILWNVSKKATLETKFDGNVFNFAPDEKKKIYIPDIVNHLIYKLADKGLALVPDDPPSEEILKKIYLEALKRRKKMLKDVIVAYQTSNSERKAANKGTVEPNDYEVDCVREIRAIEKEISEIDSVSKEDVALVNDYLRESGLTDEQVSKSQTSIETNRAGVHRVVDPEDYEEAQEAPQAMKRRGRPPKINVPA